MQLGISMVGAVLIQIKEWEGFTLFGNLNQRGFATLEVILMITVLGIISAIAIPRFSGITTTANTTKVQADLTTLDTAIAIYYMDKGTYPSTLNDLSDYIQDISTLKPPTGKIYINGTEQNMPATEYSLISSTDTNESSNNTSEKRAAISTYTAGHITKNQTNQSSSTASSPSP